MSAAWAGSGEIVTSMISGAVFSAPTVFEVTAAPSSVPSLGVTMQAMDAPRPQWESSRVDVVSPMSEPLTTQA